MKWILNLNKKYRVPYILSNLFLIFTLDGILIGLLFDLFRILRKSFKTADVVTYIEDTIFWLLTGIIILYSIFKFSNGDLRAFIFVRNSSWLNNIYAII